MATTLDTHNRRTAASDDAWATIAYRETGNYYTLDTRPATVASTTYKPVPRPCR